MEERNADRSFEKLVQSIVRPELDRLRAAVEERMRALEQRADELAEKLNSFTHKLFSYLEEQDKKFAAMNQEVLEKLDKVFSTIDFLLKRVESLEAEYFAITQTLRRIEEKISFWDDREKVIQELQERVRELLEKTGELERRLNRLST